MTRREATAIASREFFQTGLAVYVLLALAETLSRGIVSDYFDLNYVLAGVIIAGVLLVWCGSFDALMYKRGRRTEAEPVGWNNARNLRGLMRDRPKRLRRPMRQPASVSTQPAQRIAHPASKPKTIDGVIRR